MQTAQQDKEIKSLIDKMEAIPQIFKELKMKGNEDKYSNVYDFVSNNKTFLSEVGFWLFEQQIHLTDGKKSLSLLIQTEQNNTELNKILSVSFYGFPVDFTLPEADFLKQVKKSFSKEQQQQAAMNLYFFRTAMLDLVQQMYGKIDVDFIFTGHNRQFKLRGKAIYPQEIPEFKTHSGEINMDMYYLI